MLADYIVIYKHCHDEVPIVTATDSKPEADTATLFQPIKATAIAVGHVKGIY